MRRYTFLILFVVVLVTPFVLRKLVGGGPAEAGGPASADPSRRLVIITPHTEGIRREFQDGFSAWLKARGEPDVHIDYRSLGGGANDIVKLFVSSKVKYESNKTYGIDLVWGGGEYLFDQQLKKGGFLQPVELPKDVTVDAYPTPDVGGQPLYDKQGYWFGTALSSFGIVYNKDALRYLGLPEPKTWADLADPRYAGWLVLADPTRSASARTTFMTVVERSMADATEAGGTNAQGWQVGMGLVRQICSNARVFADASGAVPGVVGSGDAAAGMAIDFYGRTQVEAIGESRMGYVEPAGATIINADPIAVAAGAEHRELAVKFLQYVLSESGQKLWNYKAGSPGGPRATSLRRLPIRRATYADMRYFTDQVNPFTTASAFNTRKERVGTSRFLDQLLQVSCIDLLDELRDTRKAILACPDEAKRKHLVARFDAFPFDETEAKKRQAAFDAAAPIDRLAMLRAWTGAFADEYAALRAAAK